MKKKTIISILIMMIVLFAFSTIGYCDEINTDAYKNIYKNEGQSDIFSMAGGIITIVQVVSVIVAVVMLTILGIRYMYASPNDKASIKDRLIPYLMGALLIFGASTLLNIIAKFAQAALD